MKKQHKEGTCKVSESSVVFSAFYADFRLCPKLVIITTLMIQIEHYVQLTVARTFFQVLSVKCEAVNSIFFMSMSFTPAEL